MPDATPTLSPAPEGALLAVSAEGVLGWGWYPANPLKRLRVFLTVRGQPVVSGISDRFDLELVHSKVGPRTPGFALRLPPQLPGPFPMEFELRDDQGRLLGPPLIVESAEHLGLGHDTNVEPAEAAHAIGYFERVEAGVAIGWAFDPDRPVSVVEILANGKVVAEAVADRTRADVMASGQSPGDKVGFECRIPAAVAQESRCFTARIAATGLALRGSHDWRSTEPVLISGYVSIALGLIKGSSALPMTAARPDELLLEEHGVTIHRLVPTYADTPTGGLITGSFASRVPISLRDGAVHQLTVRPARTNAFFVSDTGSYHVSFRAFVRGAIDGVKDGIVSGWAFDTRQPGTPLRVEVLDADQVVASGYADQNRSDVASVYPDGIQSGFSIVLPLRLFDGCKHHLKLRCAGEEISVARSGSGPEVLAVGSGGTREQRIVGRVEKLDNRWVAGWVYERGSDLPVTVRIVVDGITVATLLANEFARRLVIDGQDGYRCFTFALPAALMNGQLRRVDVIPVGSTTRLRGAAEATVFPLSTLPHETVIPVPVQSGGGYVWSSVGQRKAARAKGRTGSCRVSVIVINWNGADYLDKLLSSLALLRLEFAYEVLIVDHGSTDASEEVVQRSMGRLPLQWLQRGANFSFSQSNNFAAAQAKGEFLLFCNNDIIFPADCITPALARFDDPALGILGFRLSEPVPREDGWSLRDHHLAVTFLTKSLSDTRAIYLPFENGAANPPSRLGVVELGAVTAALMLCRASDFQSLGGFSEDYYYGLEDVDLCLRMGRRLNRLVVCDQTLHAVHDRSATRGRKSDVAAAARPYSEWQAQQNKAEFLRQHGRFIARSILREAMDSSHRLTGRPLRVTFAVTEASIHTSAGDYFTALELGLALRAAFGWEIMFINHRQYDLADTDVLILMRHDYDLSRITNGSPALVVIAWVRNRVDEWCDGPNLDRCNLVFASSRRAIEEIAARHDIRAELLPIATNPDRFHPPADDGARHGIVFTGNYWLDPRETVELADIERLGVTLRIYGANWSGHETMGRYWHGHRSYYELPEIYGQASIVLDDSHPVTRRWDSVNSRVFDALASGGLVVTNCRGGAEDLFGGRLPSFETAEELNALLTEFTENPDACRDRAALLRDEVLRDHTYEARARTLHASLQVFCRDKVRVALKIGVPKAEERELWGDYHFALALRRALERLGFWVRIDLLPEWDAGYAAGDDVVIVLRGLSRYQPAPGVVNIMWLISHPDQVTVDEMLAYDHVFVASDNYADRLKPRLGDRVSPLLQCTDPALFSPSDTAGIEIRSGALFVGNTRGQSRQLVDWALHEGIGLDLYGGGWGGTPASGHVIENHIPNEQLGRYYTAAPIVLGDHWPDMRAEGFISNRLFDAACCGAMLAVDDVTGVEAVFGDLVTICRSPSDLTAAVRAANTPDAERKAALRSLVLERHTFDHRAKRIADMIGRLL
jgi:GT2 family glycosyltransferase